LADDDHQLLAPRDARVTRPHRLRHGLDWQACGALAILCFVVIEEIKRALRSTMLKNQLHRQQGLFDRPYDSVRQYY
jgi:hypothetical protein